MHVDIAKRFERLMRVDTAKLFERRFHSSDRGLLMWLQRDSAQAYARLIRSEHGVRNSGAYDLSRR